MKTTKETGFLSLRRDGRRSLTKEERSHALLGVLRMYGAGVAVGALFFAIFWYVAQGEPALNTPLAFSSALYASLIIFIPMMGVMILDLVQVDDDRPTWKIRGREEHGGDLYSAAVEFNGLGVLAWDQTVDGVELSTHTLGHRTIHIRVSGRMNITVHSPLEGHGSPRWERMDREGQVLDLPLWKTMRASIKYVCDRHGIIPDGGRL